VDDIAFLFAHGQILFSVWVTFGERKWPILAARRRKGDISMLCLIATPGHCDFYKCDIHLLNRAFNELITLTGKGQLAQV
jgi:hypothetical protein